METKLRRKSYVAFLVIFITLICACGSGCATKKDGKTANENEEKRTIFAMDTCMTLQILGPQAKEAMDAAVAEIEHLDRLLSTGSPDSEVSMLNQMHEGVVGNDTAALLARSLALFFETDGAFDITVFPLMEAWNFTGDNPRVPSKKELAGLTRQVDSSLILFEPDNKQVSFPETVRIDFGGIAKGYTGKKIAELLKDYDVTGALLNLGGNVQLVGAKTDGSKWNIAIQSPKKDGYLGTVFTSDCAVVTSGGYERYFVEDGITYHHILDPKTGYPAQSGLASVTVICADGTLADGLSTALFVMGEKRALEFWRNRRYEFDCILYTDTGELLVTGGLKDCFSSELSYRIVE